MNKQVHSKSIYVALISLGCAKNLVDSEEILGRLGMAGYVISSDVQTADVIVINTCAFIKDAKIESINTILEFSAKRNQFNPHQAIIVAGCLPQRYKFELPKILPDVDLFIGVDQIKEIDKFIPIAIAHRNSCCKNQMSNSFLGTQDNGSLVHFSERPSYILNASTPRLLLTPPYYAYVKIAEGCNHPCSFCIIPQIRGRYRSRPIEDVVNEVEQLVSQGVREINLISQDTTYYGWDWLPYKTQPRPTIPKKGFFKDGHTPLIDLLTRLESIPGHFWIRLLYTHPAHWTEELIKLLASAKKVVPYVDLPLQHVHPSILEKMQRHTSREWIEYLLTRLIEQVPGVIIRTTFIVGFPGETETEFEELLKFMEKYRFHRVGVFTYSKEEGTRAATFSGHIAENLKKQRAKRLFELQRKISGARNAEWIGRCIEILVEKQVNPNIWKKLSNEVAKDFRPLLPTQINSLTIGRSYADAPEVDGNVYVPVTLPLGNFVKVKVIAHTDYDLIAIPA